MFKKNLKEEIKMKTQELKNKKSFNLSDQLIVISFPFIIILSLIVLGMILSAGKNVFTENTTGEHLMLSSLNSVEKIQLAEHPEQQMEIEKLVSRMNSITEKMELETLMTKVQEYLIPEKEPDFSNQINIGKPVYIEETIHFNEMANNPDFRSETSRPSKYVKNELLEKWADEKYKDVLEFHAMNRKVKQFLAEEKEQIISTEDALSFNGSEMAHLSVSEINHAPKYVKNQYLEKWAREKYDEVLEFYAMEKKVREFLIAVPEPSLALENWMTNGKCWCTEPREQFAYSSEEILLPANK